MPSTVAEPRGRRFCPLRRGTRPELSTVCINMVARFKRSLHFNCRRALFKYSGGRRPYTEECGRRRLWLGLRARAPLITADPLPCWFCPAKLWLGRIRRACRWQRLPTCQPAGTVPEAMPRINTLRFMHIRSRLEPQTRRLGPTTKFECMSASVAW